MVLRKQTVWLITMLSLLIVLSVYYMMSPGGEQVALIPDQDEEQTEENLDGDDGEGEGATGDDATEPEEGTEGDEAGETSGLGVDLSMDELSADELFTTIRLETEDARSELREQLSSIVASAAASTEEKNEAMEEMYALQTVAQKESILEQMIQQEKEFRDVLVRHDEDVVNITVITTDLSPTDANHLMQMARDEFGDYEVIVRIQEDEA
ncbi:SpoIIIAH-like family protein [Alkalibacillus haloalkaliphilus]|uniref:Stage III sporulation protein AH n=1 Tax=Alkalibacillus haloalkaliphilus TaxID=94136 RepID=A0A511W2I2_9BACI|nr:SpoIIIAH-like family protein [Alkalibacillus haloalkaliphilus]GEN45284.1 stage III sporulation protein AH [Alkalibacillus haloalkaliphilus]